jgi:hypothetical protein
MEYHLHNRKRAKNVFLIKNSTKTGFIFLYAFFLSYLKAKASGGHDELEKM